MHSYIQELLIHTERAIFVPLWGKWKAVREMVVRSALDLSLSNLDTGEVTGVQLPAGAGLNFFSTASRKAMGTSISLSSNHQSHSTTVKMTSQRAICSVEVKNDWISFFMPSYIFMTCWLIMLQRTLCKLLCLIHKKSFIYYVGIKFRNILNCNYRYCPKRRTTTTYHVKLIEKWEIHTFNIFITSATIRKIAEKI
jgi:hypothetical protein